MSRITALATFCAVLFACGKPMPRPDAGEEVDAGMEVDAGRPRGDDPPNGWQVAVPLPMGAGLSAKLVSPASTADQHQQPLIAAVFEDPNGDLNYDDNRVVFSRWDGVAKAFTDAKIIEVVGGSAAVPNDRQVSIARDDVTGRIVIAYVKAQTNTIRIAVSDDEGANFSLSTVDDEVHAALDSNPSVAARGGVIHVAFLQGSNLFYRSRTGTAAWVDASPAGISVAGKAVSLALDAEGNAAVAFFVPVNATSADLAFWRVGSNANAIASADMFDVTVAGREPSVSLTFAGTTPHLAYHLQKVDAVDATQLWYLKALDTGTTWAAPAAIPRNSSSAGIFHSTQWYQAITVEAAGQVSIAAPWSATGTQVNCNGPKLARSSDGASFMTCSPLNSPIQRGGDWVSLWSHKPNKLTLIFSYDSRTNPSIKPGVVLWREL